MIQSRLVAALLVLVSVVSPRADNELLSEEQALGYAGLWIHGVSSVPDEERLLVAADRGAIALYAALLEGRRTGTFHRQTALWWVAESGDPAYVPLLLRLATDEADDLEYWPAVYGLAKSASVPAARERLLALARSASQRERRGIVLSTLAGVNDKAARAVLRVIDRTSLSADGQRRLEAILAAPALRRAEGRYPCPPPSHHVGRRANGAYGCVAGAP